eukprot:scaffold8227_cov119-Isochrysis_galbana.AAC.5
MGVGRSNPAASSSAVMNSGKEASRNEPTGFGAGWPPETCTRCCARQSFAADLDMPATLGCSM